MKQAAFEFSEGMLSSTEKTLAASLSDVRDTRKAFVERAKDIEKSRDGTVRPPRQQG